MSRQGIYEMFACDTCGKQESVSLSRGRAYTSPPVGWISVSVERGPEFDERAPSLYCSRVCAVHGAASMWGWT